MTGTWVIQHDRRREQYWNGENGWGARSDATVYDQQTKDTLPHSYLLKSGCDGHWAAANVEEPVPPKEST